MYPDYPLVSLALWLRWTMAAALLLWLPGHLLVGRHLAGASGIERVAQSLSWGLLLMALLSAVAGLVAVPAFPWVVWALALLLAWRLGVWAAWNQGVASLPLGGPPHAGSATVSGESPGVKFAAGPSRLCAAICLGMVVLLVLGFRDFSAPPHLDDASNHAFLSLRIAQTGSTSSETLFASPYGVPKQSYLVGWHFSAAALAGMSGVAPAVSVWLLAVLATALLPATLMSLWRLYGFSDWCAALAGVVLLANAWAPTTLWGWGGFGALIGMFVLPALVWLGSLLLVRGGVVFGVALGLGLSALVWIHASELVVWPLLMIPAGLALRRGGLVLRSGSRGAIAAALVLALAVAPMVGDAIEYSREHMSPQPLSTDSPLKLFERFLRTAGGRTIGLEILLLVGISLGLKRAWTRGLALLSLALGFLWFALTYIGDPVSRWLTAPFYQQAARVLYLQVFLTPPLMMLPLLEWTSWLRRGWGRIPAYAGLAVLLASILLGVSKTYETLRSFRAYAPFSAANMRQGSQISGLLDDGERIANLRNDGSFWLLHSRGIDLVDPTSWELGAELGPGRREAVAGLIQRPWPAASRALWGSGVEYLYISDVRLSRDDESWTRHRFRQDARFEEVLEGDGDSLFRIRWDIELPYPADAP